MAFRLPSQKKFKPNVGKATVARKASIPASLAKPNNPGPSSAPQFRQPSQAPGATSSSSAPAAAQSNPPSSSVPGVEASGNASPAPGASGAPPTIGSAQLTPTFREPSLPPPSRKRAASPTPSNASRSSRTGGRPTLIHLAASTGPARRPTPSASPAPNLNPATAPVPQSSPVPPTPPPPTQLFPPPASPAPRHTPTPTPAAPAPQVLPEPPAPVQDTAQSSGFPPSIGTAQIDPVLLDQTPGAGPSRSRPPPPKPTKSTQELANDLIAEIAATPGPSMPRAPKLTKAGFPRKKPVRTAPYPKGDRDPSLPKIGRPKKVREPSVPGEEGQSAPKPPRKKPRKKTPELDENGEVIRRPRAPYGSKGKAMTDQDGRLRQNKMKKRTMSDIAAGIVEEFAEDEPIDPGQVTMGSFAGNFYDSDLTERAIKLKESLRLKQEEARNERAAFERQKRIRLQPLRRRERTKRNVARAERREAWEASGAPEGEEEVSDDEIDSTDEEYVFEPDRLTPPGSPEPVNYDEDGNIIEQQPEGAEDDEEEEGAPAAADGLGLDFEADNGEMDFDDENAMQEDQDDEGQPVDLADYGFSVGEDQPEGEGVEGGQVGERDPDEPEPDYSALFEINPGAEDFDGEGGAEYSLGEYQASMDRRRAQALATQNSRFVVQEDDDETRMVNSTSWRKREKTDKWTDDETDFFYSILGEVGENYTLMKAFFPGRSVAQIKKKGLRENAKNPEKVTTAIMARKPIDNGYLQKSAGYDPDREWTAEEALFAEAKRDQERLVAEDRGEVYGEDGEIVRLGDIVHDDEGEVGDETMDMGMEEGEGDQDLDQMAEGEEAGEGEGEVAEEEQGEVEGDGPEPLFLQTTEDDDGTPPAE